MSQEEHRNRQRVPFIVEAVLTVDASPIAYPRTRDVSMSGIYLLTANPLPVGTQGTLALKLESGLSALAIEATCEVVRQDTEGMGLKFTHMDSDSSINLFNVIRYQGELPDGR